MQITVGEYGQHLLHSQSLYVRAVESGLGVNDLIEVPDEILFRPYAMPKTTSAPMLKEYAGTFLTHKKQLVRAGSHSLYDEYLKNGILPFFGAMPLDSISENRIQDFVTVSARKGRSSSYIRSQVILLKSVLRSAERDGILKAPSMQIVYPKQHKEEISVLTEQDTEKLNDYLLHDRKTISTAILIALHTGIRVGEMCGLRWNDIDFKKQCIHIQRSVKNYYIPSERHSVREIGDTKTPKSNRWIYMTDDFTRVLYERQGTGFIYTGTENFIDTCSARQALNRRLEKLDIPHIRFHALRHGFATRAIQRGVDPKTVAAILGHEKCDITLNIYTSCTPDMQREAMSRLEAKTS